MLNNNLGVWDDFTNKIRHYLQNDNIENFLNWDILIYTMIANIDEVEFNHLISCNHWDKWKDKLNEDVLQHNSYHKFMGSSTNNLHHAYSLQIMMEMLDLTLNEITDVVEFGGGYGNTCRLFKKWDHNMEYYIYDIPELSAIQKFYLDKNNITNVTLINGDTKIDKIKEGSLFLGLWSISETPIQNRKTYLENLLFFKCDNIFLAMGSQFYNENNMEWLENEIIPKLNELGYKCILKKIEHGNGMYYFSAKRFTK